MARPLRIQYAGARYHLMSRGDRRDLIFLDDRFAVNLCPDRPSASIDLDLSHHTECHSLEHFAVSGV
jgi:hypothetical protein